MILLPDHRPPPGLTKGQAILAFIAFWLASWVFIEWMMR